MSIFTRIKNRTHRKKCVLYARQAKAFLEISERAGKTPESIALQVAASKGCAPQPEESPLDTFARAYGMSLDHCRKVSLAMMTEGLTLYEAIENLSGMPQEPVAPTLADYIGPALILRLSGQKYDIRSA